jgi:hypothetical protein
MERNKLNITRPRKGMFRTKSTATKERNFSRSKQELAMKLFARMHVNKLPTVLPTQSRNPSFTACPLHQIKLESHLSKIAKLLLLAGSSPY